MKALIFHGTDCTPNDFWYPWLKAELEARDWEVRVPSYPNINHQPIDEFLPDVLKDNALDSETVVIGHSAGSPLILSLLQHGAGSCRKAVLVAGYSMRLPNETPDPVLEANYDWEKIAQQCDDFIFINSINDPWGCDDRQGRLLFDKLGGTQIIRDEGHFGSTTYEQPYREFPLVRDLVLEVAA